MNEHPEQMTTRTDKETTMSGPALTVTPEQGVSLASVPGTWPGDRQATVRMPTAAAMAAHMGLHGVPQPTGSPVPAPARASVPMVASPVPFPASPDPVPRIDVLLRDDGTGDVLVDGASVARGINVAETYAAIVALVLDTAGRAGRPVLMSVVSADSIHRTLVAPDGSVCEHGDGAQHDDGPTTGASRAGAPTMPATPSARQGWPAVPPQTVAQPRPAGQPQSAGQHQPVGQPGTGQPEPGVVWQKQPAPIAPTHVHPTPPSERMLPVEPRPRRLVPGSPGHGAQPQTVVQPQPAGHPEPGVVVQPQPAPVALAPVPPDPPAEPMLPAEPTLPAAPAVPSQPPSVDRAAGTADLVPLTGPAHPQRGVRPPADGLAVRPCPPAPLVVLGAHGGSGESALATLVPGWVAADHAWPAPGGARQPVVLVARTSLVGLTAARTVATQWASGQVPHIELVGLLLVADAPGRLPRPLRDLAKVVSGGVPRVWHVPWVEAWRTDPPLLSETPKEVRRTVRQLDALTRPGATGA